MHIFSVKDLFSSIKITLEETFPFIMVKGSVSSVKKSSTGHMFFELKDDEVSISCVCWKEKIDKLKFIPKEGKEVLIKAYITTFKNGTRLNLIVIDIELYGIATILEEIEKLKIKLEQKGYFNIEYKKPIPLFPSLIGIITSETGAVLHDILNRIQERFPTKIELYSATMQGDNSVESIIQALKYFNNKEKYNRPNVIIIARGGGSFEDLLPFNNETLIEAVFNSKIPIVSAIGHETDTTLIDLVADKRASTPTAAAELVTYFTKTELKNNLNSLNYKLNFILKKLIVEYNFKLENLKIQFPNISNNIKNKLLFIEETNKNIFNITNFKIQKSLIGIQNYKSLFFINKENILSPLTLKFFSLKNNLINPIENLNTKKTKLNNISKNLYYFTLVIFNNNYNKYKMLQLSKFNFDTKIEFKKLQFNQLKINFYEELNRIINKKYNKLYNINNLLKSLSFYETLNRGFSVLLNENNHIVNSINDISNTEVYTLQLKDGTTKIKTIK